MTQSLTVADTSEADPLEVARFLMLEDPRFFEHEYRTWPDLSIFVQARLDGRLIGTQGIVPYPLYVGGKQLLSGRTERAMVDPSWRMGGLFAQLIQTCASRSEEKGYDLLWGMTGLRVPFQYNGFLFFENFYEHALLCIAPSRLAADLEHLQAPRMRVAKLAILAPSLVLRAASCVSRREELAISHLPRLDSDVDGLLRHLRGREPIVVMRHSPVFVEWIQQGRRLRRFYAYDGDALAAYAYVDVSRPTTATLLDFGARDARSMRTLLHRVVREMAERDFAFLYTSYNATNPLLARQRTWLMLAGFVPFHRAGGFVVRPLRYRDNNYLADIKRWYITRLWNVLYHQNRSPP